MLEGPYHPRTYELLGKYPVLLPYPFEQIWAFSPAPEANSSIQQAPFLREPYVIRAFKYPDEYPLPFYEDGRINQADVPTVVKALQTDLEINGDSHDSYPRTVAGLKIYNGYLHRSYINLIPLAQTWYKHEFPLAGTPEQPVGQRIAQALELMYKPHQTVQGVSQDTADEGEGMFLRWAKQALGRSDYSAAASHAGRLIETSNPYWVRQAEEVFAQVLDAARQDQRYFLDRTYFPGYVLVGTPNKPRLVRETDLRLA